MANGIYIPKIRQLIQALCSIVKALKCHMMSTQLLFHCFKIDLENKWRGG
jgi:hypothetical protein